jgi:penicillin-binding protein 2
VQEALDPRLPFNNRPLGNMYSPGSTFKTVSGIIGLTEGVIDERTTISCPGYFTGCGTGKPKCLDKGTFSFTSAIAHSDNTYFSTVYKRLLDQSKYGSADSALSAFNEYAYTFGLGHKLGVDLPSEKNGNLPVGKHYRKIFGPKWYSCNVISNAIGQGEVQTTLLQLANVMAIISNKGWYYTPHIVDSIEGGDEYDMLASYKTKHYTDKRIHDSIYDAVQDGMQAVVEYGTAVRSKIPGIIMCGKTGTVENYDHGVKQQDHSFFGAFAPRDNPQIAIAVMCENAGQGAWAAAPIASLLVEKYLRDSIAGPERQAMLKEFENKNLIPLQMRLAMATRDSIKQVKEAQKRLQEKINKEAIDSTDDEEIAPEIKNTIPVKPVKDSSQKKKSTAVAAILNDEEKKKKQKA